MISKPKCGCTTIIGFSGEKDKRIPHFPAIYFKKHLGEKKWNKVYKFAISRNSYDLVLSWYHYHKGMNFYPNNIDDWILKMDCKTHFQMKWPIHKPFLKRGWKINFEPFNPLNQYQWIIDENSKVIVDDVIKLEELTNETLNTIFNKKEELVIKNEQNKYPQELSKECIKKINEIFKDDFLYFNYEML